jgi:hypothetical protein
MNCAIDLGRLNSKFRAANFLDEDVLEVHEVTKLGNRRPNCNTTFTRKLLLPAH